MDRGCVVVFVMLDLSAAFDTTDHGILLSRLTHRLGVTRAALEWFRSYVSGRQQLGRTGSDTSSPMTVLFGVPRGSVLGTLLFTAYSTPLGDIIRNFGLDHQINADNPQLTFRFVLGETTSWTAVDVIERLCSCLEDPRGRLRTNLLKLNDQKTDVVVFGTNYILPLIKDSRITISY